MRNVKKSVAHLLKRAVIASSLALCTAPFAHAEELKDCLIVHMQGGSKISYVLEDTPVVSFAGENLHVEAAQVSNDHKLADVEKFTFEKSTSLSAVLANECRIIVKNGIVTLEGLTPSIEVRLSDMQGRMMASTKAGTDGIASLPLDNISTGVYIVSTTDGKSFKIFKK